MTITCDPPRHALLFRFQEEEVAKERVVTTPWDVTLYFSDTQAGVNIAGIEFRMHRFQLPFDFSEMCGHLYIRCTRRDTNYLCLLRRIVDECSSYQVYDGVHILVVGSMSDPLAYRAVKDRPLLLGFRLDTIRYKVKAECPNLVLDFATDNLKG